MATVSRNTSSRSTQSMRLTVKTSSSKLREATSAESTSPNEKKSVHRNGRESLEGGQILPGKRSRTVKKSYVVESESDEDEEMEDLGDEDAEGEDIEEEDDDDDDDDAEGEADADGDIDMDDQLPPPKIKISKAQSGKILISARPAGKSHGKTVEQKEADDSDAELSDLGSDDVEDVDDQEVMQSSGDEDAEGEDEEIEVPIEDEEEEPTGSEIDTPGDGSRASSPDLSKLTKRQRARLEEGADNFLMKLPDEPQVKKHLTAEEHAMRRAEMARRRKNLSEKRNEEEKMETINKLLKKQAPKTNSRRKDFASAAAVGDFTPIVEEPEEPDPLFIRWVSNKDGCRAGVPKDWLQGPAGAAFGGAVKGNEVPGWKMVQEVQ